MWTSDSIRDLIGAPEWQERAQCAGTDTEAFYPEMGGSGVDAKRICARCEVRKECLDYALSRAEAHGIWGGTSERERRRMLSAATKPTPATSAGERAA